MSDMVESEDSVRRILIVRLSALGDVVNTLPALTALRKGFPKAHIAWLVEDRAADLLQGHPFLDEVIVFTRSEWRQAFAARRGRWRAIAAGYRFFRELRSRRFDMAIDFQGNAKSGFLTYMSGARLRVGFDRRNSVEGNIVFTNRRVRVEAGRVNRAEKYLALARAVGGFQGPVEAVLPCWPAEEAWARAALREARLRRRPLVILHPGTSEFGAFKRWPPRQFGELAQRLRREFQASVLVTWGPRERSLAQKVAALSRKAATVCPATRNVRGLAELIRRSDLFISADTGPMHIAAALGVPVVALFGPKDPVLHGPYGAKTRVVRAGVACSPCTKRACDDPKCMHGITPEMVMEAAREMLKPGAFRKARRGGVRCESMSLSSSRHRPETRAKR